MVVSGEPGRVPLVHHHGTPHSADTWEAFMHAATDLGLRYVSASRPGYGSSVRVAGRAVAATAEDIAVVLDWLGAGDFLTVGVSSGGPHALACAALLGDRVVGAATIGSLAWVTPKASDEFDFFAEMGAMNVDEHRKALAGSDVLLPWLQHEIQALENVDETTAADALGDLLSEPDVQALTRGMAQYVAEAFRAGVAAGPWGWHDDALALVADWEFEPHAISVPVDVWHGHKDRAVPLGHGRLLAQAIPSATLITQPDDGHLSLLARYAEVVDRLVMRLG